jgi:histone-lysine N-methyltransferase SETMAR
LFVGETKPVFLQHGGARPNTSAATSEGTQYIELEVVPHRPYSPDLAPYEVWWVAALSNISNEFISHVTKFKQVRKKWLQEQSEEFYNDGLGNLVQRRQCCIEL